MPSLNLDLDYFTHPKVRRLVALLGVDSVAIPIKLWCYVGKYHSATGMLVGYSKQEIESVLEWTGPRELLVDTLLQIRFLDLRGQQYVVHDWKEHAGHLAMFKKRAKTAASMRWKKYASSNAQKKSSNAPTSHYITSHSESEKEKKKKREREECEKRKPSPVRTLAAGPASGTRQRTVMSDEEFRKRLEENPAYRHLDLAQELARMDAWLLVHPQRKKTRRFIVGWLNRTPAPLPPEAPQPVIHRRVVL